MNEMEQEKIVSLEADRLLRNALDKKAFAEKLLFQERFNGENNTEHLKPY